MNQLTTFFLVSVSLFPLFSHADLQRLPWSQLDEGNELTLSQDLPFAGETLKAGSAITVSRITPLGRVRVVEYRVFVPGCPDENAEAEMEIVLPEGAQPGTEVGVQVQPGCQLDIYVEHKDLAELSLFY